VKKGEKDEILSIKEKQGARQVLPRKNEKRAGNGKKRGIPVRMERRIGV